MAESCDECSPCWPHRGGFGRCSCDCHPADPAADLEYAMAVIQYLLAENKRLRDALGDILAGLTDALGDPMGARPSQVTTLYSVASHAMRPVQSGSSECPAGHGTQCCGYPAACEAALGSSSEENDRD